MELTGKGCDMVAGTRDDGVCLSIELGWLDEFRAKFVFTGEAITILAITISPP